MAKLEDVTVQLTGTDGNVFAIVGKVSRSIREAGYKDEAQKYEDAAFSSKSYDEVLILTLETVNVK